MKVLFVASEAAPLAKVGGLADVVGSLPKALTELGHDVRVIIPQYGCLDVIQYPTTLVVDGFKLSMPGGKESVTLRAITLKDKLPVYMVENQRYFGGKEVYSKNDLERFFFFSQAVFELLPQLDWQPEIVHCHDWHAALVVMWQKKTGYPYGSIFTIHNLAYQGVFNEAFLKAYNLKKHWEGYPQGAPKPPLNFMSQGILWADLVTTVSETYAKEIVTPEYGEGLDPLLSYRQKSLLGIVNGIDYEEYNPETDPYIPIRYNSSTLEKRIGNKLALQRRGKLPEETEILLIGIVQRLDEQKGLDILGKAIDPLLKETKIQLVILGRGREHYEDMLKQIASRYPQQIALFVTFDNPLAHLIYAGCDAFLMPSRFEPCGLGQLIAMRYGALPVVRHTGGLVDTVPELTPDLSQGNGFVFKEYAPEALITAVKRATEIFRNKRAWYETQQRVMALDFSWRNSALKYEAAYQRVLEMRKHA